MVKDRNNQDEIDGLIRYRDSFPVENHKRMMREETFGELDSLRIEIDAAIPIDMTHAAVCARTAAKIENHFIFHGEMAFDIYFSVNHFGRTIE